MEVAAVVAVDVDDVAEVEDVVEDVDVFGDDFSDDESEDCVAEEDEVVVTSLLLPPIIATVELPFTPGLANSRPTSLGASFPVPNLLFISLEEASFSPLVSLETGLLCTSFPAAIDVSFGLEESLRASFFFPADFSLATASASAARSSSECSSKEWKQFLHKDFLQAWGSNVAQTIHTFWSSLSDIVNLFDQYLGTLSVLAQNFHDQIVKFAYNFILHS